MLMNRRVGTPTPCETRFACHFTAAHESEKDPKEENDVHLHVAI